MKFPAPFFLLAILFAASPLAAKNSQPQFNTIAVKHFANAGGMNQSPEFIHDFSQSLRSWLEKVKIANQVVEEGTPVSDSVAADSLVIEGRFIGHDKEVYMVTTGKLNIELEIYRLSDHALVKSMTVKALIPPSLSKNDQDMAAETGSQVAHQIRQALTSVSLSNIPPAPQNANPTPTIAAPISSSAAAQTSPLAVANVQFSSDPTGAEITVDGNYAGNTPSLMNLKPGTHSIKMTKNGYMPWVRSIETSAGESRNIAADLEKAGL
jgi:hypothetical protein